MPKKISVKSLADWVWRESEKARKSRLQERLQGAFDSAVTESASSGRSQAVWYDPFTGEFSLVIAGEQAAQGASILVATVKRPELV